MGSHVLSVALIGKPISARAVVVRFSVTNIAAGSLTDAGFGDRWLLDDR
jgi:hypothetical protein